MRINSFRIVFVSMTLAAGVFFSLSGCDLENFIFGTVSYSTMIAGEDLHVVLDDDTVATNGSLAFITITITEDTMTQAYFLDTSAVPPDGTYFLIAGYDPGSDGPDEYSAWDARGWYGTDNWFAPGAANVDDVQEAQYDIVMTDRPVA